MKIQAREILFGMVDGMVWKKNYEFLKRAENIPQSFNTYKVNASAETLTLEVKPPIGVLYSIIYLSIMVEESLTVTGDITLEMNIDDAGNNVMFRKSREITRATGVISQLEYRQSTEGPIIISNDKFLEMRATLTAYGADGGLKTSLLAVVEVL